MLKASSLSFVGLLLPLTYAAATQPNCGAEAGYMSMTKSCTEFRGCELAVPGEEVHFVTNVFRYDPDNQLYPIDQFIDMLEIQYSVSMENTYRDTKMVGAGLCSESIQHARAALREHIANLRRKNATVYIVQMDDS